MLSLTGANYPLSYEGAGMSRASLLVYLPLTYQTS